MVELNRRFLHGYSIFKDEPRVQALLNHVLKYNRLLQDLGLRDHQVSSYHLIQAELVINSDQRYREPRGQVGRRLAYCYTVLGCWASGALSLYRV